MGGITDLVLQSGKKKEDDKVLRRIITSAGDTKGVHRTEGRAANSFNVDLFVPTTLEDAPIRRQDRRTLNALRRRRTDK